MKGEWINDQSSKTNIVWVHGILSKGEKCWSNSNGTYWPQLLSTDTKVRDVGNFVFTYKSNPFSGDYSIADIVDYLKELIRLEGIIESENIVFVCHSMGGIVVRKYLTDRSFDLIKNNTKIGLYLIASPSLGAKLADYLSFLAKLFGHDQALALKFIDKNKWLFNLNKNFRNLKESGELTIIGKEFLEDNHKIVAEYAGSQFFGESVKIPDSNHSSICKPKDETEFIHRQLISFINKIELLNQKHNIAVQRNEIHKCTIGKTKNFFNSKVFISIKSIQYSTTINGYTADIVFNRTGTKTYEINNASIGDKKIIQENNNTFEIFLHNIEENYCKISLTKC